jgi:hypothetical protein
MEELMASISCQTVDLMEVRRQRRVRFQAVRPGFRRMLYLEEGGTVNMTQLEVGYRYGAVPGEAEMRAVDNMREVYGIRRVRFDENERTVRVEFDASRLKEPAVASLLRRAGIDLKERLALA